MQRRLEENDSLLLVDDLQRLLVVGLDSIAGKTTVDSVSYLVWGASSVSKMIEGYSELRKREMIYPSKVLIRPVIETTAAVVAAVMQTGFLFQKAYAEFREDTNLLEQFRSTLEIDKQPTDLADRQLAVLESNWNQFIRRFGGTPPDADKSRKLSFPAVLRAAGLIPWYSQYCLYCQFTHGTLRAISGDLDTMTDAADTVVIIWLALIILDCLQKHAPVELPDLAPFWARATHLMEQVT